MAGWFSWGRSARRLEKDVAMVRASPYFDEAWYCSRYGREVGRGAAAEHYLTKGAALGYDPGPLFSTSGYLEDHPDVARAGMNPLAHFLRHGQFEGRLPRARHTALGLEQERWSGGDEPQICAALHTIVKSVELPEQERLYAAWVLVRWYGATGKWPQAHELLSFLRQADSRYFFHRPLFLVEVDALIRHRLFEKAHERIDAGLALYSDDHDLRLASANLLASEGSEEKERLAAINEVYESTGLRPLQRVNVGEPITLGNLFVGSNEQGVGDVSGRPLVSVLVPTFNAQDTLPTALEALRAQDWPALEILVINDASTDKTAEVAEEFAAQDKRRRVIQQEFCEGAYAARNAGLHQARGEFITVHDADDWSHPEKISRQVEYLLANPEVAACMSHWVRCDDNLVFGAWRIESGWIERNISSLMFRRAVFENLGYWDRVRAGADSEFLQRIIRAHGEHAVGDVLPNVPLSFGRTGGASLTNFSDTHIRTSISGVRKTYLDAAEDWHRGVRDSQSLHVPEFPETRPFWAPPVLAVDVREFDGRAELRTGQPNILLVAHSWSPPLFGAERCFLDLVQGLSTVGTNVFVAVPASKSENDLSPLLQHAVKLYRLPYIWWQQGRGALGSAEANFQHLIRRHQIDMVYSNTVVLWEPLLAARACGVRTVVHVHELAEADPELCETLKADPEAVRQHVVGLTDSPIAPSELIASWLGVRERTIVLPNTFDPELLTLPVRSGDGFHVALVSSNIPKKGLTDFVEMARHLFEAGASDISCLLIGPDNLHIAELKEQQIPKNLRFAGLAGSPVEAIAQADVLVNLSHAQESFGRTVLEAMAGGRPVVCYDRGALSELVIHRETGFLVPFANTRGVAKHVLELYRNPDLRRHMGDSARRRAAENFAREAFLQKLQSGVMPHVSR